MTAVMADLINCDIYLMMTNNIQRKLKKKILIHMTTASLI